MTLRGLGQGGVAYQEALKTFANEFGEKTGAKIEFDDQPWEQLMPKLQAELAANQPTYDFFYGDIEFQYSTYPALVDLNPLIKKYNYNMEGFFDPVYKYGEGVTGGLTGQRFGLPIRIGACWVFYRTDLIKEFPKTWDAYYKMLGEQTTGGKYGVAFAGVAAQLVKIFLARYWSQGDPLMKPDWTPLINGAEGRQGRQHDAGGAEEVRAARHARLGQPGRVQRLPQRRCRGARRMGELHPAEPRGSEQVQGRGQVVAWRSSRRTAPAT